MTLASKLSSIQALFDDSITGNDKLVVAFSGGLDSTALLYLSFLYRQARPNVSLQAIHVNHQLSPKADDWSIHCAKQCEQWGIDFQSIKVDIHTYIGQGIEAAARQARYAALIDHAPAQSVILLGQHLDDQAETFLLQLSRGAGPKGLSAMGKLSVKHGQRFVRPLLAVTRQQILSFAREQGLKWVEDESNNDLGFDRNFLRKELIPLLNQRWPSFSKRVASSANACASEMAVINEYMGVLSERLLGPDNSLLLSELSSLSSATQQSFVRHWLTMHDADMPSSKVLQEILDMQFAKNDAMPCVKLGNIEVRRYTHSLYVTKPSVDIEHVKIISSDNSICLPDFGATIFASEVYENGNVGELERENSFKAHNIQAISVAYGKLNDPFKPHAQRPRKTLKAWCKEWRIPPWRRKNLVCLYLNQHLIGVIIAPSNVIWSSDRPQNDEGQDFYLSFS
ncbi:tRNA lysidine(34) synthetase TilS [Agaribacter flavus]|uniref:tRNA(Ile)-lysidine synthase n=1 Tax=Agaribacter flavus TaxID=1902781 RepID=A0ABV7FNL0_9ALTE